MPKPPELVAEGRLRYFAASDTTVVAATPRGRFKLFRIVFGRDGSIYIPFPYLETKTGLLSEVEPTEADPRTFNLRKNGAPVSTDVKFSHHASGVVQFSRTGGTELLPRRRSFPLTTSIGRIFELHAYHLEGFAPYDSPKKSDFALPLQFPTHPSALRISAAWFRKADIVANAEHVERWIGPDPVVTDRSTGFEQRCLFLGQPAGHALRKHVVMLSADIIPLANGADVPTMLFLGGYDPHEGVDAATPKRLSFMYPVTERPDTEDGL